MAQDIGRSRAGARHRQRQAAMSLSNWIKAWRENTHAASSFAFPYAGGRGLVALLRDPALEASLYSSIEIK
jgi:hypothetical protein